MKLQRNEKCPCGSGKKYKKCCYLDKAKKAEIIRAANLSNTWEEMAEFLSKPPKIYRLKVVLIGMRSQQMEEEISRTFELAGDYTLYDFHLEIQDAFNWDNDHMFSFYMGDELYDPANEYSASPLGEHIVSRVGPPSKSASETQIRELGLTENSKFLYLFDYGDELVHEVTVEKIYDINNENIELPAVVSDLGTSPSQYGDFD